MQNAAKYEAVHLFIERAASVLPPFRLTQENAPALARVCRRFDGMPLAIELDNIYKKRAMVWGVRAYPCTRFGACIT